jgi:hypothetical protein
MSSRSSQSLPKHRWMRLRRNTFAAATWSGSEIFGGPPTPGHHRPPSGRRKAPAPGLDQQVSADDWARRFIMVGRAEQIELHPRDVVPAVVFPFDAPV